MTSSEEFLKSFDYINELECLKWYDFKKVPENIAQKVFSIIESGTFIDEYHIGWSHPNIEIFMKTKIPKKYDTTGNSNKSI